ncbi:MAG: ABC transporter permease [Acetivibrionales bacterium]|jgi:ribose transport system permease protein
MYKFTSFVVKQSHVILLLVVCAAAAVITPSFLKAENIANIIIQQIPYYAIMAFGMTMAVILKGIDLSIGANMALSSCVGGYFIVNGQIAAGILASLAVGILIGLTNGILITKIHLPPFIATYCMDWISKGIAYVMMMGAIFYPMPAGYRAVSTGAFLGIPSLLWITFIIFALLVFLMSKTIFGRNVYTTGSNINAAKLSGVNTDKVITTVYIMNGILASIAGLLLIARLNAADATYESGWSIKLIAAVLIGGTPMKGGTGSVGRTLVGVLIITVINNCLNMLNVSSLWQQFVIGSVIILSIFVTLLNDKIKEWNKNRQMKNVLG